MFVRYQYMLMKNAKGFLILYFLVNVILRELIVPSLTKEILMAR